MKSGIQRRQFLTTAAAVAASIAVPSIGKAQSLKTEYKLSVTSNRPAGYVEAAYQMADIVAHKTNGRINIKVYPQSQLVSGDATREFPSLRRGLFEFVVGSTINLTPHIREMALFSLPFLMPDSRAWDAVVNSDVRKDLEATLISRDVTPLSWSENGFRQLCNSKREILRPADMSGLKVRYAANPLYADIFSALGANPVQMSWGDLQTSLATGAVDGLETPVNTFIDAKLYTIKQHFMSIWNYSTDANIFMVSTSVWKSFSAADQAIIKDAAEQVAKLATAESRKGVGANGDRSSFKELEKLGVKVSELTDAEKAEFRKATSSVMAKWAPLVNADLVKKAQNVIARSV